MKRPEQKISVGDRVESPSLGKGTVKKIDGHVVELLADRYGIRVKEKLSELTLIAHKDGDRQSGSPSAMRRSVKPVRRSSRSKRPPDNESAASDTVREEPGASAPGRPAKPRQSPSTGPRTEEVPLRQAMEALRFGLVPSNRLKDVTIGFDAIHRWLVDRLPQSRAGKPQVSEICGPFGTGKSHTAAVVRQVAREEGYVTAHVEVDGQFVSLSDPEKLLYSLWGTLRASDLDSSTPVLDLYVRAADDSAIAPMVTKRGSDRVRANFKLVRLLKKKRLLDLHAYELDAILSSSDEFTANEVTQLIRAHPEVTSTDVLVKRMIGLRVTERPDDLLKTIVGMTAIIHQAGYRGLVITIDEFEVEHNLPPDKQKRIRDLLRAFTRYLGGDYGYKDVPLAFFFATIGQDGHQGDDFVETLIESTGAHRYPLTALGQSDRSELAQRIFKLYTEAYHVTARHEPADVQVVEDGLAREGFDDSARTRAFIKRYMARLDSRHGPSRIAFTA